MKLNLKNTRKRRNLKTRANWKMGFCMKSECMNRDSSCGVCVRYSEYAQFFGKSVPEILNKSIDLQMCNNNPI